MSSSNLEKKRVMTQQPKVPHFIRVIIQSDYLLQGKLAIPRKFMREHGSALSESVVLKVPSGMTWKVELIKSGDEILFGKGWDKFVKRNGIEHGYLIVFRYQGSCHFRVIIFDLSATEIAYPCNSGNHAGEGDPKRKTKVEERNVNKEEDACTEREGEFSGTHGLKPEKKMEINADVDQKLLTAKEEGQEWEEWMPYEFPKRNGKTKVVKKKNTVTKNVKENALSRATAAFKSANPSFMVIMQPAYIRNCYLNIPFSFHKYLHEKGCVRTSISSPSGRTWPVTFHHNKRYTRITSGWKEFVQDNILNVGDVCAFELIDGTKTAFKVVIFRAAEDATPSYKQADNQESRNQLVTTVNIYS